MNSTRYYLVFLTITLTVFFAQSQEVESTININWSDRIQLTKDGETYSMPRFGENSSDDWKPNFIYRKRTKDNRYLELSLEIASTEIASTEDVQLLEKMNILADTFDYDATIAISRDKKFISLRVFPFIHKNGSLQRITSIRLIKTPKAPPVVSMKKDFVANSVLVNGSGNWVKIAVVKDGIHKIDKAFLAQAFASQGINISSIHPNSINIYGNGEGRLPENNAVYRTDDLAKNAIQIVGGDDGSFDDGDYILFNAFAPSRKYANSGRWQQDTNPYSLYSYYFININPNETPLRIQPLPLVDNATDHATSSYSYFSQHEQETVNLLRTGQRWYGEKFDLELTHAAAFPVPNIDASSPAVFQSAIAAKTNSGGNTMTYKINGSVVNNSNVNFIGGDYARTTSNWNLTSPPENMQVSATLNRNSPNVIAYWDYVSLNARRFLAMMGGQYNFTDLQAPTGGETVEFNLTGMNANSFVWDITDRHIPKLVSGILLGENFTFKTVSDTIKSYVASAGTNYLSPTLVGAVQHQNLHGLDQADYLIISPPQFFTQANRLADLHRDNGLTVHVVSPQQIYNEFSSGMLDATAIRMFAKMFYDRGVSNPSTRPKYLLLFGDGVFDHRGISYGGNYIQTYETLNSEDHIASVVSDDYFGLLDDLESFSPSDEMDIAVGRLLISSTAIAKQQVDKIEHYMKNGSDLFTGISTFCNENGNSSTFGDWRTRYVAIADDEESGYFIHQDTEPSAIYFQDSIPEINVDKIYLDAYQQITTAGGPRYPQAVTDINNTIQSGILVFNYVGHGGEVGVAEERVLSIPQIQGWTNIDRMPLMVSATCEFTKYDDPTRVSAGEWVSLNPNGGAIALMTTSRSVYFDVNTLTIRRFTRNVFKRDGLGRPMEFGEIIRRTKNEAGNSSNKRSFTLIGDPALRIALPSLKVILDSVNGIATNAQADTIQALDKVTMKGHLEDHQGNILSNFNGVIEPTIFDKEKTQQTLGQDPDSPVISFGLRRNRLYKGKASVSNGYFEFSFVAPKDIDYQYGKGKISLYANTSSVDAIGVDTAVIIGGINPNGINDNEGPTMEMYINDDDFVSGGVTNENPILIVKLFDENGINTVGNGIGHDLVAVLDNKTSEPYVLNNFYSAELDSYQSGEIRYNFSGLEPGRHTLKVKVWDVNNNSSEQSIEFVVAEKKEIELAKVFNYPNPFTTNTEFMFEHNQACIDIDVNIQIFTITGKVVKTINKTIQCNGFRADGIQWNGRDEFGDKLARGTYVYQLSVRTPDGNVANKTEKLVIL